MGLSTRGVASVAFTLGLATGTAIGWVLMRAEAERQIAEAEAANGTINLRVIEALHEHDLETASGWVTTGLTGNAVVLGAWANGGRASTDDFPTRVLRDIADLDAESSIFTQDPEFKDYVAGFRSER